jgi:hypothetical protein
MLLSGCASYRAVALSNLSSGVIVSSSLDKNGDVMAYAKVFTKNDCMKYLDRDVISKGYQPLQLCIQNNSDKIYSFSTDRITLSSASAREVADRVHTSTVGRVTGYAFGALFIGPLIIPAIIDGMKSSEANQSLDSDYLDETAKDQLIQPYSHINAVIFVPRDDFKSNFSLTLIDIRTNEPTTLSVYPS